MIWDMKYSERSETLFSEETMSKSTKNQIIKAEYIPSASHDEIDTRSSFKLPVDDLSDLGSTFAIIASEIGRAIDDSHNSEGLYRCVFPEGVTGKLATFKDNPEYNLGTIINENGLAGQARWKPFEAKSAIMSINPAVIAIAVAVFNINQKLDQIEDTTREILQFLQQDKESVLEATVNTLADIFDHYRFNSDNDLWKVSQLTVVTTIKGKAEQSIIFYRKEIEKAIRETRRLHVNYQVDKAGRKIQHHFKYYQLGVYLYAYASFLEVVLNGNFRKDYLDHICEKLREYSQQYRFDYTEIYDRLESYTKSSVETIALKGIGKASKGIGSAIGRIPVVSRGPVDEALIAAGNSAKNLSRKHSNSTMRAFRNNRDAGIQLFLENIDKVNQISNKPVEILFNRDMVYITVDPGRISEIEERESTGKME